MFIPHKQEKSLTCEVASLFCALSALCPGKCRCESELEKKMPMEPMFGNPYRGFVGDPGGRYMIEGYGIYAEALLPLVREYCPNSFCLKPFTFNAVTAVLQRNPIIIWMTTSPYCSCEIDDWIAVGTGLWVPASRRIHVCLLFGDMLLMDPWTGKISKVTWDWVQDRTTFLGGMNIVVVT